VAALGAAIGYLALMQTGLIAYNSVIAKRREKRFLDWWFLSAGASSLILAILYALGVFNFLIA